MEEPPHIWLWIASHIDMSDDHRLWCLKEMWRSLEIQTRQPDGIYYSCTNGLPDPPPLDNETLSKSDKVHFMFEANSKISQFHHFKKIWRVFKEKNIADKEDVIFFMDDDDLLHPERFEEQTKWYSNPPQNPVLVHLLPDRTIVLFRP